MLSLLTNVFVFVFVFFYFGFKFTFVSAGASLSYQAATDALVTDQFLAKEDEGASCWQPSSDQFKVFKIRFSKSEKIMRFESESVEGLGWLGWLLVRTCSSSAKGRGSSWSVGGAVLR